MIADSGTVGEDCFDEESYLFHLSEAGAPTVAPVWLVGREEALRTGRRLWELDRAREKDAENKE